MYDFATIGVRAEDIHSLAKLFTLQNNVLRNLLHTTETELSGLHLQKVHSIYLGVAICLQNRNV
jgi:hypothetical protein